MMNAALVFASITHDSHILQEKNALDLFVMYNPAYATVKEEMSAAAYGRDYKELEEHTAV